MKNPLIIKEISWLHFNERVLQEAQDGTVPLGDRIKFLAIYSSNLDEFYRVRVATLKRLSRLGKKSIKLLDSDPEESLAAIQEVISRQRKNFEAVYKNLFDELERNNIHILKVSDLTRDQENFVRKYFNIHVRPKIFPVMLDARHKLPKITDTFLYLGVVLIKNGNPDKKKYSIVEIPTRILPRFLLLPARDHEQNIILIDEVIRLGLGRIFSIFNFDSFEAYNIKITRDAELDIDDDISTSFMDKVEKSLLKRIQGEPVRLVYDREMPQDMVDFLIGKLKLKKHDTVEAGDRYHNFKDFINFDQVVRLPSAPNLENIPHRDITGEKSIIRALKKKDILLYFPYHSFGNIIDLLREASIDPKVTGIKITLYRVARFSSVINALINAIKNRKEVTVLLELQARFDEKANIGWANRLKEEGANVCFSVSGIKVHSKLCLIMRREKNGKIVNYCSIGTGNFNEDTARIYTDAYLLTRDKRITREVEYIFDFFENNYKIGSFKHLIVSPFSGRAGLKELIKNEIKNASKGRKAYIHLKLNNLADPEIVDLLYQAGRAGVAIKLIVRSMFSMIPGIRDISANIQAVSIVDKYLEHSRIFIFGNDGDELVFISSADLMPRNLDRRVEVICPIYDGEIHKQLKDIFNIQWKDTVKARLLAEGKINQFRTRNKGNIRSQDAVYDYLKNLHCREKI